MFFVLAVFLGLTYVVAIVLLHTAPFIIHVLLALALVSFVLHLRRGAAQKQ